MHEHLSLFVRHAAEAFELEGPLYRFGLCPTEDAGEDSLASNFGGAAYIDLGTGEPDAVAVPLPNGIARTIVCASMLEQVADPGPMLHEMIRILAPGGAILLAATLDRPTLGGTWVRHRLQPDRVSRYLAGLEGTLVGWQGDSEGPHALYAIGFKAPIRPAVGDGVARFLPKFSQAVSQIRDGARSRWAPWLNRLRRLVGWTNREQVAMPFVIDLPPRLARQSAIPKPHGAKQSGSRLDLMQ